MTQKMSEQLATAKYREEAPSKRVRRVETRLGTKQTHRTIFRREGCRWQQSGEKQILSLGSPVRGIPRTLTLKTKGAGMQEFLEEVGLKSWNFKNQQAQLWESWEGEWKLSPHPKKIAQKR